MGKPMVVDGPPTVPSQKSQKTLKRKRPVTDVKDIEALAGNGGVRLMTFFRYYNEMTDGKLSLEGGASPTLNLMVACLIEERGLPFSRLVDEVYERLRIGEGNEGLTLASVRGAVLFVGQKKDLATGATGGRRGEHRVRGGRRHWRPPTGDARRIYAPVFNLLPWVHPQ